MTLPAKRFSLSRLLAPTPARPAPPVQESAPPAAPIDLVPTAMEIPAAAPEPPVDAAPPSLPRKTRPLRSDLLPQEDRHPKKKRSYTVDMKLCEDLEMLAWYMDRSSSSVVEELVRKYLSQNRQLLEKARGVKSAR